MHLWNNKEGWYADYDLQNNKIRNQLTAAALFPLYVNAAAKDRAAKVAAAARAHLLQPGGLATTSVKSGQQWMRQTAGRRYNGSLPKDCKIMGRMTWQWKSPALFNQCAAHLRSREKLVEKYDVSSTGTGGGGGEYPLQDGFGWTNGVTLKMLDLICPQEKPCDSVPSTRPASLSATPTKTPSAATQ